MMTKEKRDNRFFPRTVWQTVVNLGLLLVVAGTAMPLLHLTGFAPKVVFSAGAVLTLAGRMMAPSAKGYSLRVRRLCRLEVWTGIIFCVGAFFMWYTPDRQDWLAFTLAGAALQAYASVVIPAAMNKERPDGASGKQRKK